MGKGGRERMRLKDNIDTHTQIFNGAGEMKGHLGRNQVIADVSWDVGSSCDTRLSLSACVCPILDVE